MKPNVIFLLDDNEEDSKFLFFSRFCAVNFISITELCKFHNSVDWLMSIREFLLFGEFSREIDEPRPGLDKLEYFM